MPNPQLINVKLLVTTHAQHNELRLRKLNNYAN